MLIDRLPVPEDSASLSAPFRVLQESSIHAVSAVHLSGPELKEQGLMWVVIRYELTLSRALCPGEELLVTTWASPFRHKMSQRSYLLADAEGRSLGQAAGIWALVNRETRHMADGSAYGIDFPTEETGREPPRPAAPEVLPADFERVFTVSEEWLDLNGHMNNIRYFDVAQACLDGGTEGQTLTNARVSFLSEALAGDELTVSVGCRENLWTFSGTRADIPVFQLSLQFDA